MNCSLLDSNILSPIADICKYKDNLAVISYNSTLSLYSGKELVHSVNTFIPFTKICEFKSKIVTVSYSTGILCIYDSSLNLLFKTGNFNKACLLLSFNDFIVVGTMNNEIFVLNESSEKLNNFSVFRTIQTSQTPTSITSTKDSLCIAFQNTLKIFNYEFIEIYNKVYSVCITSVHFHKDNIIAIGLINGKIHIENLNDNDESFLFNAHTAPEGDKKILYPVTHMEGTGVLLTSGLEGKLLKWDIENKKMLATGLNCKKFIRKFVSIQEKIFLIMENDMMNELYQIQE